MRPVKTPDVPPTILEMMQSFQLVGYSLRHRNNKTNKAWRAHLKGPPKPRHERTSGLNFFFLHLQLLQHSRPSERTAYVRHYIYGRTGLNTFVFLFRKVEQEEMTTEEVGAAPPQPQQENQKSVSERLDTIEKKLELIQQGIELLFKKEKRNRTH